VTVPLALSTVPHPTEAVTTSPFQVTLPSWPSLHSSETMASRAAARLVPCFQTKTAIETAPLKIATLVQLRANHQHKNALGRSKGGRMAQSARTLPVERAVALEA
jgi:hypothetical protein